jgi:hypothetical protein
VYLKESEPILLTSSVDGISPENPLPPALPKNGNGKDDFKFFDSLGELLKFY